MPILTKRPDKKPLGIYVHVPFCRSKCQYCDFYSLATKEDNLFDGYLDAVCDHIKEAGELAPNYKVDSVYFGGGTPSFFGADGLAVILTAIRRNFDVENTGSAPRASTGSAWAFSPTATKCSRSWVAPTPTPRR